MRSGHIEFTVGSFERKLDQPISRRTVLSRAAALGVGVPVISALIAACAEADDDVSDEDVAALGEDDDPEQAADDESLDEELSDDEDETAEPLTGGSARVAIAELQADVDVVLNPVFAAIAPEQTQCLLHFGGLVKLGAESELMPDLVDTYEISDDALELTFELLDDANWSDGEPFTADDVIFTFELIANPDVGAGRHAQFMDVLGTEEFAAGEAESISGLSSPDEKTLIIELSQPNAIWLRQFNGNSGQAILPKHIYEDIEPTQLEGHDLSRNPEVGAGPFLFSRWESEQFLEFVANEAYVHGAPSLDSLILMLVGAESAVALLEAGDLDATEIPHGEMERVDQLEGIVLETTSSVTPAYLVVNTAQPHLSLPVRQAMMYAIDHQAIIDNAYGGYAAPMYSHFFADWDLTEEAELNTYDYDPDRARELLEEADWDSERPLQLIYPTAMAVHLPAWTMVQAYLRDVGMNVELQQMEFQTLRELRLDDDAFEMHTGYGGALGADPGGELIGFTRPDNLSRWTNSEFDELAFQGVASGDPDDRREIYIRAAQILNEELPWIYLCSPDVIAGRNERLNGYVLSSLGRNMVWNAHEWSIS